MIIKVSHSYYSKFWIYRKSTEKKIKINCGPPDRNICVLGTVHAIPYSPGKTGCFRSK